MLSSSVKLPPVLDLKVVAAVVVAAVVVAGSSGNGDDGNGDDADDVIVQCKTPACARLKGSTTINGILPSFAFF
jgi:hypothetical protein